MSGYFVIVRAPFAQSWLDALPSDDCRTAALTFVGVDGTWWRDAPVAIQRHVKDGEYHGDPLALSNYATDLRSQGALVSVLSGQFYLANELSTASHEEPADPLGYDIVFTAEFESFYSILLHGMCRTDPLGRLIQERSNSSHLVRSKAAAAEICRALGSAELIWPDWLEDAYREPGEGHFAVVQIDATHTI
jgi:hypothetical protein